TATTLLIRSILEHRTENGRVGYVGETGWSDGLARYPACQSSLNAPVLASMLAAMVERQCRWAVLALTPNELAARLCEGIQFQAALVLDWRTTERAAIARVVRAVRPEGAIVLDADDPDSALFAACNLDAQITMFGRAPSEQTITACVDELDHHGA